MSKKILPIILILVFSAFFSINATAVSSENNIGVNTNSDINVLTCSAISDVPNIKPDINEQMVWGVVCGWILILTGTVILVHILVKKNTGKKNKSQSSYTFNKKPYFKAGISYKKNNYKYK